MNPSLDHDGQMACCWMSATIRYTCMPPTCKHIHMSNYNASTPLARHQKPACACALWPVAVANDQAVPARCRHNLGYWHGHDFYGFGLGATSNMGGGRFARPRNMAAYRTWVEALATEGPTPVGGSPTCLSVCWHALACMQLPPFSRVKICMDGLHLIEITRRG